MMSQPYIEGGRCERASGSRRRGWGATCLQLGLLAVGLTACAPVAASRGSGGSAAGSGPVRAPVDRPMGRGEGDSRDELAARLERQERAYSDARDDAESEPRACRDLCDLSANICETRDKLCEIADNQPNEDGYQNLCRRATRSCQDAQVSCLRCTESFVPDEPGGLGATESEAVAPVDD